MKMSLKVFVFILSLLFFVNLSIPVNAEESVSDQFCENDNVVMAEGWWYIEGHNSLSQTFTPTKNRLTSIMLALAGGTDVNAAVKMELSVVGGGLVLTKTETTQFEQVSWVEFTFPTKTIDTTQQYKITVTTTSGTAKWIVSTIECYPGGTAFVDNSPEAVQDFGFITLGYDFALPTPTSISIPASTSTPIPTNIPTPMPTITTMVSVEPTKTESTPTVEVGKELETPSILQIFSGTNIIYICCCGILFLLMAIVIVYLLVKKGKKKNEAPEPILDNVQIDETPKVEVEEEKVDIKEKKEEEVS